MNMLDMHTREKVNKIHIAEMHREARNRHSLRALDSARSPDISGRRVRLLLVVLVLAVFVGAFLILIF